MWGRKEGLENLWGEWHIVRGLRGIKERVYRGEREG